MKTVLSNYKRICHKPFVQLSTGTTDETLKLIAFQVIYNDITWASLNYSQCIS
jgi:hypothetical protein